MNVPQRVSAYWYLFRLLTMPARYQYWILIASIGCAVPGVVGQVLGYWWLWIPAVILFAIWVFNAALVIHGQLLVMASNRSLNLLPGMRQRALVIHLAAMSLVSVPLALFQFMKGEALVASLIGSWTLCSLLSFGFIASLVFSLQYGLLLLWLCGWGFYQLVWPLGIPLWLYCGIAAVAWWLYIRWWLRWLPPKQIGNPFMVATWASMQERSQNAFAGQGILVDTGARLLRLFPARKVTPGDVCMHLLMGGAGSLLERLMNWLILIAVVVLIFLLCRVVGVAGVLKDIAEVLVIICFWGFLSGAGLGFVMWMYQNLGRVWLNFPGSRSALFNAIERRYLQGLLLDSVLFCCVGLVVLRLMYSGSYPDMPLLLWGSCYFVLVLTFWWFYFQYAWLVYCRTHGSIQWWNFAMFLGLIGQLVVAGGSWWLVEHRGLSPELVAALLALAFLLSGLVLRPLAQSASVRMSFARRAH